jgi:hypothetical protein
VRGVWVDERVRVRWLWVDEVDGEDREDEKEEDEIERERANKDERVKELWRDEKEGLLNEKAEALGTSDV